MEALLDYRSYAGWSYSQGLTGQKYGQYLEILNPTTSNQ